jgi:hypothetical protein
VKESAKAEEAETTEVEESAEEGIAARGQGPRGGHGNGAQVQEPQGGRKPERQKGKRTSCCEGAGAVGFAAPICSYKWAHTGLRIELWM